jgi:hypothetical protein
MGLDGIVCEDLELEVELLSVQEEEPGDPVLWPREPLVRRSNAV